MDLVRFNFVNCVIKSCREEVEVEMNIEEIFGIRVFDDAPCENAFLKEYTKVFPVPAVWEKTLTLALRTWLLVL